MSAEGPDAIGTLRWGLRRYRALFLVCLLFGGVLAPLVYLQRAEPTDAAALVIAQRLDMDLTALPRYGEAVFDNGQVAQAVSRRYSNLGDYEDIVPDRVSLVAEQDSIVFQVVGHDVDPETAAGIANTAAEAFLKALNAPGVGVGAFALQSPAEPPAAADDGIDAVFAFPAGIIAGLVLGLGAVALLLVARRPVIDGASAEEVAGVRSLGTVIVPRKRRGAIPEASEFAGLVPVCRRLLKLPTPIIVVGSRLHDEGVRQQLSVAMASILRRVREVRFIGPPELEAGVGKHGVRPASPEKRGNGDRPAPPGRLTVVDSSDPLDLVQPPQSTVTVLAVPEGIGSAALRAAVVEHLGGSAEARLLLFRQSRRFRGTPASRARAAEDVQEREAVALAEKR